MPVNRIKVKPNGVETQSSIHEICETAVTASKWSYPITFVLNHLKLQGHTFELLR